MELYSANIIHHYHCETVSKVTIPELPQHQQNVKTSVSDPCFYECNFANGYLADWYTNWKNRGYLSQPALARNPLAEERWKALAVQLSPSRQKLQL